MTARATRRRWRSEYTVFAVMIGVLVIAPAAKLLGRIHTGEQSSNCAWGDDGSMLYITSDYFVVRVKTLTKGAGW